jgi:hypothetical protein
MECCLVPKNPCLLLSDVSNIIGCTFDDLLALHHSYEISIRIIPPDGSYIWRYEDYKIIAPVPVIIGDSFWLEDDDLEDILENGETLINHTEDGYLSRSNKFKFYKVTVTAKQLAISEKDFKRMTEPDSKVEQSQHVYSEISEESGSFKTLESALSYQSDQLKILIKASKQFWGNADPNEKDTHTKNEKVIEWLIKQGFSNISAKQGATIIRPVWAAKGNY